MGPIGDAHEGAEAEDEPGEYRGRPRAAEFAGEPAGGGDTVEMDENVEPVDEGEADFAAMEFDGREQPVEWVGGAGELGEEGLADPEGRVPEGEAQVAEFAGDELEARELHAGEVWAVEEGELVGEEQAPIEGDADGREEGQGTIARRH